MLFTSATGMKYSSTTPAASPTTGMGSFGILSSFWISSSEFITKISEN